MAALIYLGRKMIKNMVKQLLKRPLIVVFYAAIIGVLLFSFMMSADGMENGILGEQYLPAALLIAFYLILYFAVRGALTRGTTVFSLEDVQLLFPSPVSPQIILMYGVVRQCAASLTLLFVLVCQMANLRNLLGMNGFGIAMLILCWFLASIISQVIALTLYALFAERPGAKRVALWITNASAVAMVLIGGWALLQSPTIESIVGVFSHGGWAAFPLVGWMVRAVLEAQGGQTWMAALWLLPALALSGAILVLLWKANPDYYEDVLSLSQERFELRQRVQSQGKSGAEGFSRRKVRLGKTGLSMGKGASAFFFKHMLEMRREGVLFIDQKTLLYGLCVGIGVFSMHNAIDDAPFVLRLGLVMMVFTQMIFTITGGRFIQEMLRPFLYMAPVSARSKVLFANLQPALKAGLDALLCFGVASVAVGFDPLIVLLSGVVIALMNLIFTGGTLLTEWILGENQSKMLSGFLYFFFEMILVVPGVVLFFIASMFGAYLGYVALAAYAALVSLLLFTLLGGMLHNFSMA